MERRAFLRDAALMAVGALAAMGVPAAVAEALPTRFVRAIARHGDERAYAIPVTDGVDIDKDESVIVARAQGKAYVFNLACPHQNTALRWDEHANGFRCPKHKSRYAADGTFIDGRATRSMDRFAVRRDGGRILVDLGQLYREDENPDAWKNAFVTLDG